MALDDALKVAIGIDLTKDLTSTDLHPGSGWLPVEYAEEFIDLVRERNWCRQLFQEINMPGATFDIPKLGGDASVYYVDQEISSPSAQAKPTFETAGTVRLVAKKLMTYAEIANEVEEDAKIAMLPLIKMNFARAMADAEEEAFILGDTGSFAAPSVKGAFNGVIKLATVTTAYATDLITTINKARYDLGKYGRDPRNLICLLNPYAAAILRIDSNVFTVDKYGPHATILSGELGKLMGITLIEHPLVPITLGQSNDGLAVLMTRDAVLIGDRRRVKFDQDKNVKTDSLVVAISERIAFCAQYADAINKITAIPTP